jgi:L-ascorbate metabolism protein UlaG (beta-lactamase superfamily)
MQIHFLRHATLILRMKGVNLLIDPMLSPAEAMEPVQNAANQKRIPLVELPLSEIELSGILRGITGVLVTHTHRDHWDMRAVELLPKSIPTLCQPEDEPHICGAGFTIVTGIQRVLFWHGFTIHRIGGRHGSGEIGRKMGQVSGFVVRAENEPTVYLAGDTVWCPEVADALQGFTPDIVVVNAGAASFLAGGPITMTAEDVIQVCRACPSARVVAVHMEAVNHCGLTREGLRQCLEQEKLAGQVSIPSDGAILTL